MARKKIKYNDIFSVENLELFAKGFYILDNNGLKEGLKTVFHLIYRKHVTV